MWVYQMHMTIKYYCTHRYTKGAYLLEFLKESLHDCVCGLNTSRDQFGCQVRRRHHTNKTAKHKVRHEEVSTV